MEHNIAPADTTGAYKLNGNDLERWALFKQKKEL